MSKVQISDVLVLNNPANFMSPLHFKITFDCMENLEDDLEWKLIYVGSAESEAHDQVLDTIYVGPVPKGQHMFVFTADPPNPAIIPSKDLLGATVVLFTGSYHDQEFVRVGYFVNNDYEDPEMKKNPPEVPEIAKINRSIMAEEPRVTRFRINWSGPGQEEDETNGPYFCPIAPCDPIRTFPTLDLAEQHIRGVHGMSTRPSKLKEGTQEVIAGPSGCGMAIHDSDSMQEGLPTTSFEPSTTSSKDDVSMDEEQ